MTLLSPPFALGAAGQVLSGRLLRLSQGASFRPAAAAIAAVSGVLHGPAGSMGELTLVNPTTVRVNPFVAAIQGTHSTTQGQYIAPNDAQENLTIGGQHATLFRRDLIAVTVADSQAAGVATSPTTDRAYLHVITGTNAASNPALPAVPANTLLLGEVSVPPVGQTVTLTPYNPVTSLRGAILPVFDDATTGPGHGGEPGVYVGQYRDHPTRGLQRWAGALWGPPRAGVRSSAWSRLGVAVGQGNTLATWVSMTAAGGNDAPVTYNSGTGTFTVNESREYVIRYQLWSDANVADNSLMFLSVPSMSATRQLGIPGIWDRRTRGLVGVAGGGGTHQYIETTLWLAAGATFQAQVAHLNASNAPFNYDGYVSVSTFG